MRAPSLVAALLLACHLGGCLFQNVGADERLRDAVVGINDELRWSRMDLAVLRVHPTFKQEYARRHHRWGQAIQIADMELLDVRLAESRDAATSVVAVSWYRYDTMTLHRSVIRQRWTLAGGAFMLASERIVDGDPVLLEPPPPPEEDDEEPLEDERVAASR